MPEIVPVSELRNYGNVLEKVKAGEPVYLTKNGYGVYSIRTIEDEEKYQQATAMLALLSEIVKGINSAEKDKLYSKEEVISIFASKGINLK